MAGARGELAGTVAGRKCGNYPPHEASGSTKTTYSPSSAGMSISSESIPDHAHTREQAAWTNYGRSTNVKNVLGSALILSGIAAFIKVERIITTVGGTIIHLEPPVDQLENSLVSASSVCKTI